MIPARRPAGITGDGLAGLDVSTEPILYTQAGCADSTKVRAWLTGQGIAFTERDVSRDPEAASALAATGTFATPLLVVGREQVLGFRPEALAAMMQAQ